MLVVTITYSLSRPVQAAVQSQGPNSAAASTDCTEDASAGTIAWTNPGNAFSSNDTRAVSGSMNSATSRYIKCLNYGFSIPSSATILGFVVGVERQGSATSVHDGAVRLVKGGTIGSTDRSTATGYTTSDAIEDHGSSTDLWGTTWTPSDVNGSTFGVAYAATKGSGGGGQTASVDHIKVTVYYSDDALLNQTGYIWENDDEDQAVGDAVDENSQQVAGSTAITGVKKGERLTLRMQVKNTGGSAFSSNMGLFYDHNDGIWNRVTQPKPVTTGASGCTSPFTCSTVQDLSANASFVSMAIDKSGVPWVAFQGSDGSSNGTVVISKYVGSGGNCTDTAWQCTTVNDPSDSVGRVSLAFNASGTPYIAFHDTTTNVLYLAYYQGFGAGSCSNADWQCDKIDDPIANNVGGDPSLAFDTSGNPWISYYDSTALSLKVAKYVGSSGTGCTAGTNNTLWNCYTVDNTGTNTGQASSIAIASNGRAWISFADTTNVTLRYATYVGSGGNCTDAAWNCYVLDDPANSVGTRSSIAFDPSGNPWVSYSDDTANALKVAKYVSTGGTGCTNGTNNTAWNCTTVDDLASGTSAYNSIAFDPSGNPWVAYYDSSASALKVTRYVSSGGNCTDTAWTCYTADDPANNVGSSPVIAFDFNGTPWVAYSDTSAFALKVARLQGGGEISAVPGLGGDNGDALSESHADMTSVTDTSNRDDADCIGGGTWNAGKWFEGDIASGISLPVGSSTAQCTEVAFTIDTSQAVAGNTYRFIIASNDATASWRGTWRGPASVSAYATLTIESATTVRASKDIQWKTTDCGSDAAWGCVKLYDAPLNTDSSIAFDNSGRPWVAFQYTDGTDGALNLAHYVGSGGNCTDPAWQCDTIDDPLSNSVGWNPAIAFDSEGKPWISYFNDTLATLKMARYVGSGGTGCVGGTNNTQWTCTTVDTATAGRYSSIAFDTQGVAWVSYASTTFNTIKVAHYVGSGGTCSDVAWSCIVIDSVATGTRTSMAIDAYGSPWVAYNDSTNGILRVARFVGEGGSCSGAGAWVCTSVDDPSNSVGEYPSIAFDPSGAAWVSYRDVTDNALKVAKYVGSGGSCTSSAWNCSAIDDDAVGSNKPGYGTSIAFDPAGSAMISYQDFNSKQLKYARYVGSGGNCTSTAWNCSTIENPTNDVAGDTMLAFDSAGVPWIAYDDLSASDIKIAKMHMPTRPPSITANITNPGRSARFGDGIYHLSSGYSPRTSTCGVVTDLMGFCSLLSDDSSMDSMTVTNGRPIFNFSYQNNNPSSHPKVTWIGRSNIAPSTAGTTGDLVLQYYNTSTNAWTNLTTDSASSNCSTADCTLSAQIQNPEVAYVSASGNVWWLYLRVWQYENSSSETLKTDYFNVGFENTGPQLRGGTRFLNNSKSGMDL